MTRAAAVAAMAVTLTAGGLLAAAGPASAADCPSTLPTFTLGSSMYGATWVQDIHLTRVQDGARPICYYTGSQYTASSYGGSSYYHYDGAYSFSRRG